MLCEGVVFLLLECFCFEWHFLSPQNDCMETRGKIICASSNTAHHNKMLWHLDKFLLVLSYLKELLIALVFRTIDLGRLPVMSSERQLYSQSFRELLQFLRKAKMVDTHVEDLRAKITLGKSGFSED